MPTAEPTEYGAENSARQSETFLTGRGILKQQAVEPSVRGDFDSLTEYCVKCKEDKSLKNRILALLLGGCLLLSLCACAGSAPTEEEPPAVLGISRADLRVGLLLSGVAEDSYSGGHLRGMRQAMEAMGLDPALNLCFQESVTDEEAEAAINSLLEQGCQIIFSTSVGQEAAMIKVAAQAPEVQFCAAAGSQAATDALENTHNYFVRIHEARYLAGIAAGLRSETNKLGYVAAMPTPEVISGFSAYYLGAKSVNPNAALFVSYTQEWSNSEKESRTAQLLIDMGCDVISQHTDTTAPLETAEAAGVWSVGYNTAEPEESTEEADAEEAAENSSLLLISGINWSAYYNYALNSMLQGEALEQDWCEGLSEAAVYVAEPGSGAAAGTAEAMDFAKEALLDGSNHVFDGPLTDLEGKTVVEDGAFYYENEIGSAPSWDTILPGVTILP